MKCKLFEPILVFLLIFVMFFNMIGLAVDSFSFDMDKLPNGKYLYNVAAPDGISVLCVYLVDIKGIGSAVRCELNTLDEGGNRQVKNIYWETGVRTCNVSFINATTALINDHEVNINGTPYDSRTQIILPEASAKNRLQ